MKKLNEEELKKISGGFMPIIFDPTTNFMQDYISKKSVLTNLINLFKGKKHRK